MEYVKNAHISRMCQSVHTFNWAINKMCCSKPEENWLPMMPNNMVLCKSSTNRRHANKTTTKWIRLKRFRMSHFLFGINSLTHNQSEGRRRREKRKKKKRKSLRWWKYQLAKNFESMAKSTPFVLFLSRLDRVSSQLICYSIRFESSQSCFSSSRCIVSVKIIK